MNVFVYTANMVLPDIDTIFAGGASLSTIILVIILKIKIIRFKRTKKSYELDIN